MVKNQRKTPLAVVQEDPKSLTVHPRNYRRHPDDQLDHLIASIKANGLYRPVVVSKDGVILAGHGIVQAALKMGLKQVPVIRLPIKAADPRALRLMAGDNEIGKLAEIDDRALTELLKEVMGEDGTGLLGSGYDKQQLAMLVHATRNVAEIEDFDAAAHWVGMPEYVQGKQTLFLTLAFHSEAERQDVLVKLGLTDKNLMRFQKGLKLTAWWPPQDEDDLSQLRSETPAHAQ